MKRRSRRRIRRAKGKKQTTRNENGGRVTGRDGGRLDDDDRKQLKEDRQRG
jgi:hypothetical protein